MRIILLLILSAVCSFSQIMSGVLSAGGNAPGTASTPTFSPSTGSTIASGSTVTITPQSGCASYTYWATHTPPTTGDTQAVSITTSGSGSVTYYAKTIGCSGFADSAVGTATYTLTASVLVSDGFSGTNGTDLNTRSLDCALGGTCSGVTWTVGVGNIAINGSNQALSSAAFRYAVAGFTPSNGDYTVSVKYPTGSAATSTFSMVCTRGSSSTYDAYCVYASGAGYQLTRYDGSTRTDLGTNVGTVADNDVVTIQATGTGATVTVTVTLNTATIITFGDTDVNRKTANGVPRIGALITGALYDDFKVQ